VHSEGLTGIGEAATIGGPRWGDEATEGMKEVVDRYIAPLLINQPLNINVLEQTITQSVRGNAFARAAIVMALYDLAAKAKNMNVAEFLGGTINPAIDIAWTLASGDTTRDIEEGERVLHDKLHRHFKLKIGFNDPEQDVKHVEKICAHFQGKASVRVDINQGWDEITARQYIPRLSQVGVSMVEQPLARWNLAGMARLQSSTPLTIMADEGVATSHEALAHIETRAAGAFALKVTKSGGYKETKAIAALANASGLGLYGGCMLETAVGTAAYLQLFSTMPKFEFGCELFGAHLLKDGITQTKAEIKDFQIHLPQGHGIGIDLDSDKFNFYKRK
jgi:muconate cycloisomerase